MASALDPSAIQMPTPDQTFAFVDEDALYAPRPAEDLVTGSTSDVATTAVPVAIPDDDVPAVSALTAGETENPPASQFPAPPASAQDLNTEDPATARINSVAGPNTAPVPRPPVSTLAKRTGGLLGLFSNNRSGSARKALIAPAPTGQAELWSSPDSDTTDEPRPVIARAGVSGLPGVDRDRALSLTTSKAEDKGSAPIRLASAAGLARLAPNGLKVQHGNVDVKCLKPALVRVLKTVERHYGRDVVVTSGFRSPNRNKAARGSSNSLHMYCSAADIQIEGVTKWQLAEYLRSMPGRGGVGTYCHTDSVHIDIGPERDWNWRCRRKK